MLNISEFKPYVFNCDMQEVVSPPFDTISWNQEMELRNKKCNIVKLTMPEKNLGIKASLDIFHRWISEKKLEQINNDILIILKQEFYNNKELMQRFGIIALVDVCADNIKPHELTFPNQVIDRKEVMKTLNAQLEPIFMVVPDNSFDKLLKRTASELPTEFVFEEPLGVHNYVYFLDSREKIEKIKSSVRQDVGIVADGHHRLRAVQELYSETNDGFWKYVMSYITSIYDPGLMIGGVHRLVYGINFEPFIPRIKNFFDIVEDKNFYGDHRICIYSNSKFYYLTPKDYIIKEKFGNSKPLPTEIVNNILFQDVFSMNTAEYQKNIRFIYNYTDAINSVDNHECNFSILIPSWQKEEFLKFITENKLLPQKSTYFYPKIPSGIALYIKPL